MRRIKRYIILGVCILSAIWYICCLPNPLFNVSYSTAIYDRQDQLLGAQIAIDEQWRFLSTDTLPTYFNKAVVCFEDKRFYYHPGVDPISIVRAIHQNISAGRIVSGGSTISMQVIRMASENRKRTVLQKVKEAIMATRLELKYSKEQILSLWATHAPMGGNVVGLEAAAWRYFAKSPDQLTLAESALIAILPNAPSLMHLGRNREALRRKRDRLLVKMLEQDLISSTEYDLALLEDLPDRPSRIPQRSIHLLEFLKQNRVGQRITTSISSDMQAMTKEVVDFHSSINREEDIHNIAAIIMDIKSGEVISYVGNASHSTSEQFVDMVQAGRSAGSILKPLLYAAKIDEGTLYPQELLPDVPISLNGFRPENFNKTYEGAIPADLALARSLNIPAVHTLQDYGVARFQRKLSQLGFSKLNQKSAHYGLSLILGSGDVSLWELVRAYGLLARDLQIYVDGDSEYPLWPEAYPKCSIALKEVYDVKSSQNMFSAGAIYHMLSAMTRVTRPSEEGQWEQFNSQQHIAWKTGTSHGFKDAWAVGMNKKYIVGVWVGNADGEGKSGLVGVKKAGPVLFDIFNRLPRAPFFDIPFDDMVQKPICRHSGMLSGSHCTHIDTSFIAHSVKNRGLCTYHEDHFINQMGRRVYQHCASEFEKKSFFVLPSKMAYYYKKRHPDYFDIPGFAEDCENYNQDKNMALVYPHRKTKMYLPQKDNERQAAILKAVHRDKSSTIYWHLNDRYLGSTKEQHTIPLIAEAGQYQLVLIDDAGQRIERSIEILN